MGVIEMTLAVVLAVAVFLTFSWIKTSRKVRELEVKNTKVLNIAKEDINRNIETLAKYLGVGNSLNVYGDGDSSLYLHAGYEISPEIRINLLMDHLNLEIKDGEPSRATLVKKKPIKRGK